MKSSEGKGIEKYKLNYVYKSKEGELFLSVEHNGKMVLSNPSYPFFFLFEVCEPLKEIGSAKKYGHLVKKENYQFGEGGRITVEVKDGNLTINHPTNH